MNTALITVCGAWLVMDRNNPPQVQCRLLEKEIHLFEMFLLSRSCHKRETCSSRLWILLGDVNISFLTLSFFPTVSVKTGQGGVTGRSEAWGPSAATCNSRSHVEPSSADSRTWLIRPGYSRNVWRFGFLVWDVPAADNTPEAGSNSSDWYFVKIL